jgi:hypothetical protein
MILARTTSTRLIVGILTSAAALAWLSPGRAAAAVTDVAIIPAMTPIVNPCSGISFVISGDVRMTVRVTTNGEKVYVGASLNTQGVKAVDPITGKTLAVVSNTEEFSEEIGAHSAYTTTFTDSLEFVEPTGAADNFVSHLTVHLTVNADGTATAEVTNIEVRCCG